MRANSCSQNATAICRCPDCPRLAALSALRVYTGSWSALAPVSVIRSNAHRTRSVRDSGHARHYRRGNCLPCLIASYAHEFGGLNPRSPNQQTPFREVIDYHTPWSSLPPPPPPPPPPPTHTHTHTHTHHHHHHHHHQQHQVTGDYFLRLQWNLQKVG